MTTVEREFMQQVDKMILDATPQTLAKLAEIDKKSQLSATTFYDVYLHLSEADKRGIIVSNNATKNE